MLIDQLRHIPFADLKIHASLNQNIYHDIIELFDENQNSVAMIKHNRWERNEFSVVQLLEDSIIDDKLRYKKSAYDILEELTECCKQTPDMFRYHFEPSNNCTLMIFEINVEK